MTNFHKFSIINYVISISFIIYTITVRILCTYNKLGNNICIISKLKEDQFFDIKRKEYVELDVSYYEKSNKDDVYKSGKPLVAVTKSGERIEIDNSKTRRKGYVDIKLKGTINTVIAIIGISSLIISGLLLIIKLQKFLLNKFGA